MISAWIQIHPGFLLQGPPHKCALFFVDNSGVDIILGVIPFVRELLSRGTEVRNCNDSSNTAMYSIKCESNSSVRLPLGCAGQQLGSGFKRRNKWWTADTDGKNRRYGSSDSVSVWKQTGPTDERNNLFINILWFCMSDFMISHLKSFWKQKKIFSELWSVCCVGLVWGRTGWRWSRVAPVHPAWIWGWLFGIPHF